MLKRIIKNNRSYYWKKQKRDLQLNTYFYESFSGSKISGEIYFAIINVLKKNPDIKIIAVLDDFKKIPRKLSNKKRIKFVKRNTKVYMKYLAISKMLFTDTSFPFYFNKRKGQILTQFWHGTPVKKMGISVSSNGSFSNISNVQKTFIHSDWIVFNNEWSKDVFLKEYLVDCIIESKIILSSTLKNNQKIEVDSNSNVKKVLFAYTWRTSYQKDINLLKGKLKYLDSMISIKKKTGDKYEFYYSLHNLIYNDKFIDWMNENLQNIKPIKYDDELYDLMIHEIDIIVSDYSSFIFDAANYEKKIILDFSEINDYNKERGFYKQVIKDFKDTFICNDSVKGTIESIFGNELSKSYRKFNDKYNTFENSSINWEDHIYHENEMPVQHSMNKKILIYPGNLSQNGITTSFFNTLDIIINNGYNITVWAPKSYISQNKLSLLINRYGSRINIIHSNYRTLGRVDMLNEWFYRKIKRPLFVNRFNRMILNEKRMAFSDSNFDSVIHFSTYEWIVAEIFSKFECKKIIYIHNDLHKEYKYKKNFRSWSINRSLNIFDKIAFVSSGMANTTTLIPGLDKNRNKFVIIENPMPTHKFIESRKESNYYDLNFKSNVLEKNIFKEMLFDDDVIKFISIGRIGALQKNHYTLLKAFEHYKINNPDSRSILLLVGGKGNKKDSNFLLNYVTNKKIRDSKFKDDIFILSTKNVYNILKWCSALLLPSIYEGQPMVIMEAASIGVPVVVSDYISLVEQSVKYNHSIISKMNDYRDLANKMELAIGYKNSFDVDVYNEKWLINFKSNI